jgi:hypothetical protein
MRLKFLIDQNMKKMQERINYIAKNPKFRPQKPNILYIFHLFHSSQINKHQRATRAFQLDKFIQEFDNNIIKISLSELMSYAKGT